MGCLGGFLVAAAAVVMVCSVAIEPEATPQRLAVQSLGCLIAIAGIALVALGRVRAAQAQRAKEEAYRQLMGPGWRPCPECHGERVIHWQTTITSPNGVPETLNHSRPCGTCRGHGWFTPSVPGTPPPMH